MEGFKKWGKYKDMPNFNFKDHTVLMFLFQIILNCLFLKAMPLLVLRVYNQRTLLWTLAISKAITRSPEPSFLQPNWDSASARGRGCSEATLGSTLWLSY